MEKAFTKNCANCDHCVLNSKKIDCHQGYINIEFAPDKGCEFFQPWEYKPMDFKLISAVELQEEYRKELSDAHKLVIAWCDGRFSEREVGCVSMGRRYLELCFLDEPTVYVPLKLLRWYSFGKIVYRDNYDVDYFGKRHDPSLMFDPPTKTYSAPQPNTFPESSDEQNNKSFNTGKVVICWKDGSASELETEEVRVGDRCLAVLFPDRDTILVPLSGISWFYSDKSIICAADMHFRKEYKAVRAKK